MLADAFRLVLSSQRDIELLPVVTDGASAIDTCGRSHPDVALVDIDVPGMDGVGVATAIGRASPKTGVVLMSALPPADLQARARAAGARGVFSTQHVATDLADLLRGAASTPSLEAGTDRG